MGKISIAIPIALVCAVTLIVIPVVYFDVISDDSKPARNATSRKKKYVLSASGDAKVNIVPTPPFTVIGEPPVVELTEHVAQTNLPSPVLPRGSPSRIVISGDQSTKLDKSSPDEGTLANLQQTAPANSTPTAAGSTPAIDAAASSLRSEVDEMITMPDRAAMLPRALSSAALPKIGFNGVAVYSSDEEEKPVRISTPGSGTRVIRKATSNFETSKHQSRVTLAPLAPLEDKGYRKDQASRQKKKKKREKLRAVVAAGETMKNVVLRHQTSWSVIDAPDDQTDDSAAAQSITSEQLPMASARLGSKHKRVSDPDAKCSPGLEECTIAQHDDGVLGAVKDDSFGAIPADFASASSNEDDNQSLLDLICEQK